MSSKTHATARTPKLRCKHSHQHWTYSNVAEGRKNTLSETEKAFLTAPRDPSKISQRQEQLPIRNQQWHDAVLSGLVESMGVLEKGGLCPRWVSRDISTSTVQVLSLWWRRSVHPGHHRQSPCPSSHASTSRPGRSGYSPPQPRQRQC